MIKLGSLVKDKVTGYEGIAVARTEWMFGCVRYSVVSKELEKGRPVETTCFDEPQLEVISEGISGDVAAVENIAKPPHGDRDDPGRSDLDVKR